MRVPKFTPNPDGREMLVQRNGHGVCHSGVVTMDESHCSRRRLLLASAALLGGCVRVDEGPKSPHDRSPHDQGTPVAALPSPEEVVASRQATRYQLPLEGLDAGGSVISVDAPLEDVLAVVQDFRRYHEMMPKLKESRIAGKAAGATNVYFRAPILGGMLSLWALVRFDPPEAHEGEGRKVVGRMVEGNLKRWDGEWKLERSAPNRTTLRLEMLVDVKVPVPDSWITPELMWATDRTITAVRDRAEARVAARAGARAPASRPG